MSYNPLFFWILALFSQVFFAASVGSAAEKIAPSLAQGVQALDLFQQKDPRILELFSNGASMEDIAAIRGPAVKTPNEAIRELKIGNNRFFNGQSHRTDLPVNLRRVQILTQTPFAVVLSCADSRVPPEILYDQGEGNLFTTRNAGNVADPGALGTIEYAVKHLKPHVVVVMGHEGCGAVHAAMASLEDRRKEPSALQALVNLILPAVSDLPMIRDRKARTREAVVSNVRLQVSRVNADSVVQEAVAAKKIRVIGAYYEISSGVVEFLEHPEELRLK